MDALSENAKSRLKEILPGFSAYGFNLQGMSVNENILLANKTAIIMRYSDELNYLITTYDFDPGNATLDNSKDVFEKVKVVMIRHSLEDAIPSAPYRSIPKWINNFKNLECLIFDNVDLQDTSALNELNLKFLGIQSAKVGDIRKLIEVIGNIKNLEFLMHDSIFSPNDVEELKQSFPDLITFQPNSTR